MSITMKQDGDAAFRRYDWMGKEPELLLNGKKTDYAMQNGCMTVKGLHAGDTLVLRHPIRTVKKRERTAGRDYEVLWRGCDVIDILPHGEHLRLFQRDLSKPIVLPTPEEVPYTGAANYGPTQQKH